MKKLYKVFLVVLAPVLLTGSFVGCATTPKCDNDACYNRQISSVDQDDQEQNTDHEAHDTFFHEKGFERE